MRLRMLGLTVLLVFCFGVVSAYAEEPKNQLYFVISAEVKPAKVSEYEANVKKVIAKYSKHNFKYPWFAYNSENYQYYFLFPINSVGEMDDISKEEAALINKMGQKNYDKLWAGYEGTFDNRRDFFFTHRRDLSYVPENPRLKTEDANFLVWREYYIKSDKVEEAENIIKESASFYKSKNIPNNWILLQGGIGYDTPWYESAEFALSEIDYYTHKKTELETLGDEFIKIWEKLMDVTVKYKVRHGFYRPDLSYTPKTE